MFQALLKDLFEDLTNRVFVIHNQNLGRSLVTGDDACPRCRKFIKANARPTRIHDVASGSVNAKVDPLPSSLSTHILPPWYSTISLRSVALSPFLEVYPWSHLRPVCTFQTQPFGSREKFHLPCPRHELSGNSNPLNPYGDGSLICELNSVGDEVN